MATDGSSNENEQLCLVKHNFFSETRNNWFFLAYSLDYIHLRERGEINIAAKKHLEEFEKVRSDLINHVKYVSESTNKVAGEVFSKVLLYCLKR